MKKSDAIQRLSWRFAKHKTFNVNVKDIEALNTIIACINSHDTEAFKNNYLFAKLYMLMYKANIIKYDTDAFDNKPTKWIHGMLEKPLEWHIKELTTFLNHNELLKQAEEKGKLENADNMFTQEDVEVRIGQLVNECLRLYGDV